VVHYHFKNKAGLMTQTLEHFLAPVAKYVWEAVDLDCDPLQMLEQIYKRLKEINETIPWFAPFWSRELASEGGQLRGYMGALLDKDRLKRFKEKILLGQRQGLINPHLVPELIFASIVSGLFLPVLMRRDWERAWGGQAFSDAMVLDHVWAMIREGLSARKAVD
jgi:AcrR family transcriptional regulator